MLQTKVDGQCDERATKLSSQRLRQSTFSSYGELFVEIGRVPGLSRGVVCVILRSAISVEHRLVTDTQTHDYGIYIPR